MRNFIHSLAILAFVSIMTSCATITGGSMYWAKVQVPDNPNAKIEYKGVYQGTGEASFKVKRSEANKFSVTVKEEGCESVTKNFTQRSFRGWAFLGTVVVGTGLAVNVGPGNESINVIPWITIPLGIFFDGTMQSYWKPNIKENGVSKIDSKHYIYKIDYKGCKRQTTTTVEQDKESISKIDKIKDWKKLLDEGAITNEEYEKEKRKILEE